jgi:hypothetical protein
LTPLDEVPPVADGILTGPGCRNGILSLAKLTGVLRASAEVPGPAAPDGNQAVWQELYRELLTDTKRRLDELIQDFLEDVRSQRKKLQGGMQGGASGENSQESDGERPVEIGRSESADTARDAALRRLTLEKRDLETLRDKMGDGEFTLCECKKLLSATWSFSEDSIWPKLYARGSEPLGGGKAKRPPKVRKPPAQQKEMKKEERGRKRKNYGAGDDRGWVGCHG